MTKLTRIVAELEFEDVTSQLGRRNLANCETAELTFRGGDYERSAIVLIDGEEELGEIQDRDEHGVCLNFSPKYSRILRQILPFEKANKTPANG